jgi:hypothetical protein
MRSNPLITCYSVGHSSNDAGPSAVGEGVALSLGRHLENASTFGNKPVGAVLGRSPR